MITDAATDTNTTTYPATGHPHPLAVLASVTGITGALVLGALLFLDTDNQLYFLAGRLATILPIAALMLVLTLLGLRAAECRAGQRERRQAALVVDAEARVEYRLATLDECHRAELGDLVRHHHREMREVHEGYRRDLAAVEDRHRREVEGLHGVIQQVLADRGPAEQRAREQGRDEERVRSEIHRVHLAEQHQAELERVARESREQGKAEGLEEGFEVGYEARGAELASGVTAIPGPRRGGNRRA